MIGWCIIIAWVFTLFIAHHLGFEQGFKIGEIRERCEWVMAERSKNKEGEQ